MCHLHPELGFQREFLPFQAVKGRLTLNPPFGASSWAWLILSFRRFFLFSLETFFILSASGLALVWHLRRRHRRLFGATRAGIPATETKLTPTPIL